MGREGAVSPPPKLKLGPQNYFPGAGAENGCWGRPLLPEILGQLAPVGAKSPILNRYSLVAPQP